MTAKEFRSWIAYWESCPFDDAGRYHRPAALVAHAMSGLDIDQALKWLRRELEPEFEGFSEADANTFRALGLTPPMKG